MHARRESHGRLLFIINGYWRQAPMRLLVRTPGTSKRVLANIHMDIAHQQLHDFSRFDENAEMPQGIMYSCTPR